MPSYPGSWVSKRESGKGEEVDDVDRERSTKLLRGLERHRLIGLLMRLSTLCFVQHYVRDWIS